ncbi:MAG: phosphate ABC transporter permease PstA [Thermoguttaceae bacterium]|jgi:phosphate transport system permease protein
MVWVAGGTLATILLGAITMLIVLLANGLAYFWPSRLEELQLADGRHVLGRRMSSVGDSKKRTDFPFRTANKGFDPKTQAIRRIKDSDVVASTYPLEAVLVERVESSDFYGFFAEVKASDLDLPDGNSSIGQLHDALRKMAARRAGELDPLLRRISDISDQRDVVQNAQLRLIHEKENLESATTPDQERLDLLSGKITELQAELASLDVESRDRVNERSKLEGRLRKNAAVFHDSEGKSRSIALLDIIRAYQPNSMGFFGKVGHYLTKVWELLSTPPRESNTEGGLLPALFGTVTLIFLMAICSFPLGVLAGIYLGEYAQDSVLVRLVRIGVNNLAGIPSIVYGIFGLGFFISFLGSHIDQALFAHQLSKGPVFGTGGVLWAALTLGLLTVPVVIVATEEAIRVIPRGVRESSYALGATKFQTLVRVTIPLASPGMLTGFILAMARAAGEVAPLMLTGVVSSAATLPVDGKFPCFHLERQFMHLGYQIYSVLFQSPDAEAARPLVYVIALLLVLIVLVLSGVAIYLRNRMRKTLQIRTI